MASPGGCLRASDRQPPRLWLRSRRGRCPVWLGIGKRSWVSSAGRGGDGGGSRFREQEAQSGGDQRSGAEHAEGNRGAAGFLFEPAERRRAGPAADVAD